MRTTDQRRMLRRERIALAFLSAGGFLVSALPLVVLFLLRWDRYTALPAGTLRLCFGGGLILALILFKVLGKIKLPSRLTVMVIALLLVYLLQGLLDDVTLILWVATLGEAVDALIFAPLARRSRARIERLRQADVTAGAVEELLKTYVGGSKHE